MGQRGNRQQRKRERERLAAAKRKLKAGVEGHAGADETGTDKKPPWWRSAWAKLGAGAGLVAAVITGLVELDEYRQRAALLVPLRISELSTSPGGFWYRVEVLNSGQKPAKHVRMAGSAETISAPPEAVLEVTTDVPIGPSPSEAVIAPGRTLELTCRAGGPLLPYATPPAERPPLWVYMHGSVYYEGFLWERESEFCFYWMVPSGPLEDIKSGEIRTTSCSTGHGMN